MDIRLAFNKGHSKTLTDTVVRYVSDDPKLFAALMNLFLGGPYRITQRAAWPVSYCVQNHPNLAKPWIPKIIKALKTPGIHDAVKRNAVRLFQFINIPAKHQGDIFDICSTFLNNGREPIAVRVFSMTVLGNISKNIPELKAEVVMMIEDQLPYASAGFRSRARKVLKALER